MLAPLCFTLLIFLSQSLLWAREPVGGKIPLMIQNEVKLPQTAWIWALAVVNRHSSQTYYSTVYYKYFTSATAAVTEQITVNVLIISLYLVQYWRFCDMTRSSCFHLSASLPFSLSLSFPPFFTFYLFLSPFKFFSIAFDNCSLGITALVALL